MKAYGNGTYREIKNESLWSLIHIEIFILISNMSIYKRSFIFLIIQSYDEYDVFYGVYFQ